MPRLNQEKVMTIKGDTFIIKKFDPETACYWATQLMGDLVSVAAESGNLNLSQIMMVVQKFVKMNRADFSIFQKDCLRFVYTKFESGVFPLVDEAGNFAKHDILGTTLFNLTVHAFMFSISDFLDQGLLEDLVTGLFPSQPSGSTETVPESLPTY